MKFRTLFGLLLIAFIFQSSAWGQHPSLDLNGFDRRLYAEFLANFKEEIRSFDQTYESEAIISEFEKDWNAFRLEGKKIPTKWFQGYSWSKTLKKFFEQPFAAPMSSNDLFNVNDLNHLSIQDWNPRGAHSISDPHLYSQQRIGSKIIEVLRSNQISATIYGGDSSTIASALGLNRESLLRIPSPYEDWGIEKFFIPASISVDKKAQFVLCLPPSQQYLLHYAKMFHFMGISVDRLQLNLNDQRRSLQRMTEAFRSAKLQFGSPDVFVLGYYNVFSEIKSESLKFSNEHEMPEGITLKIMQDKTSGLDYALVKSDRTIWGESSAILIEAALELNPKIILFMGSAGGLTPATSIYGLSVPEKFSLNGMLSISNSLFDPRLPKNLNFEPSSLTMGGVHGHTNSPIEQTKEYITQKINLGITSIDVEQNLIAEVIQKHNQKTGANIQFGGLNVITDKPKSEHFDWAHDADLTQVNSSEKSDARQNAVKYVLERLKNLEVKSRHHYLQCSEILRAI